MKVELGDEVKDTITGFKGIAVARTSWITGCDRITLQPQGLTKDNKTFEAESFDEVTLVVTKPKKAKKVEKPKKKPRKNGGPRPDVGMRQDIKF